MQAARTLTFRSKSSSIGPFSHSKNVLTELSNVVCGSNIRRRGRSSAAALPSSSATPHKGRGQGQGRVSKDERRAMVQAFVDKYRALNSGKYPTPSAAVKEVGGSYYTVKQIIQELQYNSLRSPTTKDATFLEKVVPQEEDQPLAKAEEVLSSAGTMDLQNLQEQVYSSQKSSTSKYDTFLEKVMPKEEFQTLAEAEGIPSSEKPSTIEDRTFLEKVMPTEEFQPAAKAEEITSSAGTLDLQTLQQQECSSGKSSTSKDDTVLETVASKEEFQPSAKAVEIPSSAQSLEIDQDTSKSDGDIMNETEASKFDNLGRDISRKEKEEEPLPKTSTVWGNLRSFADGIIKLWWKK